MSLAKVYQILIELAETEENAGRESLEKNPPPASDKPRQKPEQVDVTTKR